ncbi:MAG: translation initiation factor IF-1 [Verrucomicrobia bacterium]|jgi:translation initiation factor IF-1|nr:translation initiation factor IF-1 [Verrucomicrobiota bacterium]
MPGKYSIRAEGIVREYRPPATFVVELTNGHCVFARVLSGQREQVPSVKLGDRLNLEISPADFSNGVVFF